MAVRSIEHNKSRHRKWLVIGPLPPPIDGQSKITAAVVEVLRARGCEVRISNTARRNLSRSIGAQLVRFFEIMWFFMAVSRYVFRPGKIYFSLSESVLGNLKDLLIYVVFFPRLRDVTAHMLGGSGMQVLLHERPLFSWINRFFLRRLGGVIVEGRRGTQVFRNSIAPNRMHVIKNFADDCYFEGLDFPSSKFAESKPIKVVFMSNHIIEKGYLDLLHGFEMLPDDVRAQFEITFVGDFPEERRRRSFLSRIEGNPRVKYIGRFIDGSAKVDLLRNARIFALPTYYPFEGQPVSILEAYAAGCFVITTLHAGIGDIFSPGENGTEVFPRNSASIASALAWAATHPRAVEVMARHNHRFALERFRASRFRYEIAEVLKC